MNDSVNEQVKEIAALAVNEAGLDFVHAEIVGANKQLTIRVFIEKNGGVTHADCELVSRNIEKILDEKDFISFIYLLEVSSPGLERGLYNLKDFEEFTGHQAKVKTGTAINEQKKFRGRIVGIEGEEIIFEDKTVGIVRFSHNVVSKANLEIDLEEELKRVKG